MKQKLIVELAAFVALLPILSSCNRDMAETSGIESETASITINLNSSVTKAEVETLESEAKVNNLQVFVFRGPEFDQIDAYGKVSGKTEMTLDCTTGSRQVWAFVNCPDLSGNTSKTSLMGTASNLCDNGQTTGFQMLGSADKTVSGKADVSIDVNRIASRVVLRKLKTDFNVESLDSLTFSVTKVYLLNAASTINYDMTGSSNHLNKTKYDLEDNAKEKDFIMKTGAEFASSPGVYDTPLYLYAYPNDTSANGATSLVVETQINGITYYYPIVLPELKPNKSYEINELVITRLGSDSPDEPVTTAQVKFTINVLDWTQVLVNSDGKEGGIYEI